MRGSPSFDRVAIQASAAILAVDFRDGGYAPQGGPFARHDRR